MRRERTKKVQEHAELIKFRDGDSAGEGRKGRRRGNGRWI